MNRAEPGEAGLKTFLTRLARDDSGATAIEYGLIIALIFLVIVGSMTVFGEVATTIFNEAGAAIVGSMGGG